MPPTAPTNKSGKTRLFLCLVGPPGGYAFVTPPLGLLYIAAWLRERFDLEIRVVNQRVEGWSTDRLIREITYFDPHIVGLGCMTPSAHALPEITRAVRAALPNTLIALGGPHVAAFGAAALAATDADVAVAGEGETAMEYIVRAWSDGADMADVPGVIRRDAAGHIVVNPGAPP
ncbi:MAG TPA: hypothetical protein ENN29_03640, partial [Candidatus Hydrogenedentes bacterium]|nr:hypothetical protein [Candidatus Hydrogenedentota bacterium]